MKATDATDRAGIGSTAPIRLACREREGYIICIRWEWEWLSARAPWEKIRDEGPTFFSTDPDPAQLEKYSGSGSDLKSK